MNEWISIKDSLPIESPLHSIYIVTMYSHSKMKRFVEPLHYIDCKWYTMVHEEPLDMEYEVTHWMPLPEPPNECNHIKGFWANLPAGYIEKKFKFCPECGEKLKESQ